MALAPVVTPSLLATTVEALVRDDGTAASRHAAALARAGAPMRDLADAIHALVAVHGTFPGLIDHARPGGGHGALGAWLAVAAHDMAHERTLLARLAAAAGPRPSTPGQAEAENAVASQRHALAMLARSDRDGCAAGAAIAFVLDWTEVRGVLAACAERAGVEIAHGIGGLADATRALVAQLGGDPRVDRAMTFGAQQMLAQHRGLWSLLEARASARDG